MFRVFSRERTTRINITSGHSTEDLLAMLREKRPLHQETLANLTSVLLQKPVEEINANILSLFDIRKREQLSKVNLDNLRNISQRLYVAGMLLSRIEVRIANRGLLNFLNNTATSELGSAVRVGAYKGLVASTTGEMLFKLHPPADVIFMSELLQSTVPTSLTIESQKETQQLIRAVTSSVLNKGEEGIYALTHAFMSFYFRDFERDNFDIFSTGFWELTVNEALRDNLAVILANADPEEVERKMKACFEGISTAVHSYGIGGRQFIKCIETDSISLLEALIVVSQGERAIQQSAAHANIATSLALMLGCYHLQDKTFAEVQVNAALGFINGTEVPPDDDPLVDLAFKRAAKFLVKA